MAELTTADYDALFAVMRTDIPKIWRGIFPEILAQLQGTGALTVTVTDTEIIVRSGKPPNTAVYRAERKPKLH